MTCEERYKRDVDFKALVDFNYQMIRQHRYSTTELREAAVFAATLYALRNPDPYLLHPDAGPTPPVGRLWDGRMPDPKP